MTGTHGTTAGVRRRPGRFAGNKFLVPVTTGSLLERAALLRRLLDAPADAIRVVVGSPGSGKTSLLSELADRLPPEHTVWFNTDPADADPVRFWQGLILGIQQRVAGFGADTFDLLTLDGRVEPDALESLLVDAERLPRPITVIVDDLHLAAGEATDHLRWMIDRGSPGLAFVIGSRQDLDLGLGRHRLAGRLVDIGEADLRLDVAETAELVGLFPDSPPLADADIELLHRRTEGWVGGILLAVMTLRDHADPKAFLDDLAGTNEKIAQYLSAELVDAQPTHVRAFLRDTCVVDELTDASAAALAVGSPVRLADIERRHLLLQRLDPDGRTYRYHHLFADLLRARLAAEDPQHESLLQRRAARWYEQRGDLTSCFRHLWRAGDRSEALDVIKTSALEEYLAGRRHTVLQITGTLSAADLRTDPDAATGILAALVLEGQVEEAHHLADRLEQVAGPLLSPAARLRLLSARCFESLALGDVDRCLAAGAELRSLHEASGVPADDWIGAAISLELRARAWAGQVTGWEALAARLRTTGANLLESVDHQSSVAQLCLVAGRLDEAEARCRAALGALDENPDHSPDLVTLPRAVLGTVLLERGEAVAARSQFEAVATVASPTRRPATVLALIGLSRILRIEGAFEAAIAVLDDARELLRHAPATSPMLIPIDVSRVRTLLATGEVERARGVLDAMPPCPVRTALAVHVHLAAGDPDAARSALAGAPDARVRAEELDLALARLLVEIRTGGSAITQLADEVLDHASSMRVTLPLAEAGSEVLAAMVTAARRRPQTPFLEAIQRTRPPAIPAGSATVEFEADALSERERTVLRYLVTAMSYREIADDLFVSVNTVKTHVRNILRKLQADSRAEAIDRARQLRYL